MGNTNEEELIQLKELYDELWHDAKSLIKDMKKKYWCVPLFRHYDFYCFDIVYFIFRNVLFSIALW